MPVEFLTDEQAGVYGWFREVPTRPELERFFFLDNGDRDLIALRRSDGHRLGIALQVCTVRYSGCSWKTRWMCRGRWWSTWPRSWGSPTRRA
jgi:hypothetical protein